jgi:tetratricopeptide (TPR) repeat protein
MLWLEWRIWGATATGYHVVNILLHAASAVLLWRVLLRLKIPGAWLAGMIFAVHPVAVESAAWITERKNVLPMALALLSLLWFLRFEEDGRKRWYLCSLAAFLLALLAKTMVVAMPLVMLGCVWWRRGRLARRDVVRSLPFFALSLVLGLVTVWFQLNVAIQTEVVRDDGFLSRLAVAGRAVWFYLYKAFLPIQLCFVYPRWQVDAQSVLSYLPLMLLLAAAALFWRYRSSWGRPFLFALGYYLVMLLPVLGFINIYFMRFSLVADHWQYPALAGIAALVAGAGAHLWQTRYPGRKRDGIIVASACVVLLASLSFARCTAYKDEETLWRDTVRKNPDAWIAQSNLGNLMLQKGLVKEAQEHVELAWRLMPDDHVVQNNMGCLLLKLSRWDEAAVCFQKAIELRRDYGPAYVNLGNLRMGQGRLDEAIACFRQASSVSPGFAPAHINLGMALVQRGDSAGGIAELREAVRGNPEYAAGWYYLGIALLAENKDAEALHCLAQAVDMQPNDIEARYALATLLAHGGHPDEAIRQFRQLLRLAPDWAPALQSLAWLRATCEDPRFRNGDEAVRLASRAAELTGGTNPKVLATLAAACAEAGRFDDAVATARKALAAAQSSANAPLSDEIRRHLECYTSHRPWREARIKRPMSDF